MYRPYYFVHVDTSGALYAYGRAQVLYLAVSQRSCFRGMSRITVSGSGGTSAYIVHNNIMLDYVLCTPFRSVVGTARSGKRAGMPRAVVVYLKKKLGTRAHPPSRRGMKEKETEHVGECGEILRSHLKRLESTETAAYLPAYHRLAASFAQSPDYASHFITIAVAVGASHSDRHGIKFPVQPGAYFETVETKMRSVECRSGESPVMFFSGKTHYGESYIK